MTAPAFTFTDRATPIVQIGTGDRRTVAVAGVWDVSEWDDPGALWSGDEPLWRDVTCEGLTFEAVYGRRAITDRFVPGVATIRVRNLDGWADPNADDDISVLTVRPGRAIRVGVLHDDYGVCWLFRGIIDAVTPTYEPDGQPVVQLDCVDVLGEVNRAKFAPYPAPVGAGETVDTRIARILDRALWPDSKRDLAATGVTVIADTLGGQVADLLARAADSANAVVFANMDGDICFRHNAWQMFDPATPPDATIGNGPGDVCPIRWERPFAREDITTRVIIGRDAATAQTIVDPDAEVLYGIEPFERVDLWTESDTTLASIGLQILAARHPDTAPRVRSVSLNAATGPDVLDLIATVDVYRPSRFRCRHTEPDGRLVFDTEMFATGVAHAFNADRWTLELNLDVAAPYATTGTFWGMGYWDAAWWADVTEVTV